QQLVVELADVARRRTDREAVAFRGRQGRIDRHDKFPFGDKRVYAPIWAPRPLPSTIFLRMRLTNVYMLLNRWTYTYSGILRGPCHVRSRWGNRVDRPIRGWCDNDRPI